MGIKLINIGFGNIVSANRLVAIVSPESAPIKRIIQEARDRGMLIDATYGRRTREKVKGTKNEYKQVHTDDYILEKKEKPIFCRKRAIYGFLFVMPLRNHLEHISS